MGQRPIWMCLEHFPLERSGGMLTQEIWNLDSRKCIFLDFGGQNGLFFLISAWWTNFGRFKKNSLYQDFQNQLFLLFYWSKYQWKTSSSRDMRFGIHYFTYMKYSYHCSVSLEQSRSIDHSNWSFNNLFISSKNDRSAGIHGQKKINMSLKHWEVNSCLF